MKSLYMVLDGYHNRSSGSKIEVSEGGVSVFTLNFDQ